MKPNFLMGLSLATALIASSFSATAQAPQGQSAAQPAGRGPTGSTAQVHTFTLANGMGLWVKPDRRAPTAVHMVWLRVGSMDEVDGTSGVAHVLEHMLFKGTPTLAVGEFSRRVAALGGRENAFTAKDYTGYYQQIPSNQLEAVMRLESDRFANNQWPDAEFVKELEVVKEERRLRTDDNPRAQLHEMLSATALSASPYRRPIVGWMSDLEAMTAQDARDFYRKWYTPANAVVVVHSTGHVRHAQQPMRQVRRQMRDSAIQSIARVGVVFGADVFESQQGRFRRWREFVHSCPPLCLVCLATLDGVRSP